MPMLLKAFFIIIGTGFTGIGMWIIVKEILRVYHLSVWPTVEGKVLDSQVTVDDSDGTSYNVIVEYEYKIFGKLYKGSAKLMGIESNTRNPAEELCHSYHVGLRLPIVYNPERTEQSEVADHFQKNIRFGVVLFGIFWTAFSVYWTMLITN